MHPQSIVHGLVRLPDGASLAHLGPTDMRVAISYALHGGASVDVPARPLDLVTAGRLDFEPVDHEAFPCLGLARAAAKAGGTAPCALNAANEVAVHAFLSGRLAFTGHRRGHRAHARGAAGGAGPRVRVALRGRPRGAHRRGRAGRGGAGPMTAALLAFAGFAALVILHEFGHFIAAKAVGMRVERFALFFPPLLAKVRRGETEYAIGAVPLGGYVKITGMNPNEELPPEVAPRAYYRQQVWKRIVVIGAGPAVNIALAFLILWALFWADGVQRSDIGVRGRRARQPCRAGAAAGRSHPVHRRGARLRAGSVDRRHRPAPDRAHRRGGQAEVRRRRDRPTAAARRSPPRSSCCATGERMPIPVRGFYDSKLKRMRLGFSFGVDSRARSGRSRPRISASRRCGTSRR